MNKERLMQFLSDAIDSGAYLSIHMTQFEGDNYNPVFREEAENRAKRFASIISQPIEELDCDSFIVGSTGTNGIHGAFAFVKEEVL
ncbi:hypothetical protein [Mesobacillus stamsii]|uniref:Uncharacterized protein n=1 Tax=Mesobacillus stamsii TaxID=225347 RepID=A0ABU0FY04_9BACI|nr:hypothetical protein [Mesobacillus stamsii]MDQ0414192.1 hypothetical protein [Mesobacillus stamsii]